MKQVRPLVKEILTEYPSARDDDFILVALVYQRYYHIGSAPFLNVMIHHKELGLPSFESIRRSRQWLQEKFPLIYGASGEARKERRKEQEEYLKEYGHGRQ